MRIVNWARDGRDVCLGHITRDYASLDPGCTGGVVLCAGGVYTCIPLLRGENNVLVGEAMRDLRIDSIVTEDLFVGCNVRTSMLLAQNHGQMLGSVLVYVPKLQVVTVHPSTWKSQLYHGKSNAEIDELTIAHARSMDWDLPPKIRKSDLGGIADALAIHQWFGLHRTGELEAIAPKKTRRKTRKTK